MDATNITIVGTHTVKPDGAPAYEGPLYMTAWDQIFGVLHARLIYFYKPDSQEWSSKVENLKSSLGRALAQFSPFAGRLRWLEGGHRLEIDCNGMGAEVVEAECDGDMSYFRDFDSVKLGRLVPEVDNERCPVEETPLLAVQVTRFKCGGVTLGISASHAVVDGQSVFYFLSEWARLARGEPMKEAPYLDRTIFKQRERPISDRQLSFSDHTEFKNPPLLLGNQDSVEERKKNTVKLALPLTKAQLDELKKVASLTLTENSDNISRGFSRYEVVAAHIWRCLCKARRHENEQETSISIAVDARRRIHTIDLPQTYFGNTVLIMRAVSRAGELISNPLWFACGKIREATNKVDEDYIWSNMDILERKEDLSFYGQDRRVSNTTKKDKPYHGNPNLRVISWLTLPNYHDMDFGWGNQIDFMPIARDLDGSSLVLPSLEKDGSIVVILCLQVAHVDKFKKHFYLISNTDGQSRL